MIDAREFVAWIERQFEPAVRVGPDAGHYARQPGVGEIDLYGVSDMACVLHTIGALGPDAAERAQWETAFAALQRDDGWYIEAIPTHHRLHSTAFAVAAMELLGLVPRRPLTFASRWRDPASVEPFLADLDWRSGVYAASHEGAGLGAIATLDPALGTNLWFDAYFDALDRRLDPVTGMHGEGKPPGGDIDQIGGTFHYAFLHEWHHRPMAHPSNRIDAILGLQRSDGVWADDNPLWLTLDAVYLIARDSGRSGHRLGDTAAAVRRAVAAVEERVMAPDRRDEAFGWYLGAHSLTAAVSVLAEAQRYLGAAAIRTDRPLRLVLDRRPFI